MIVQRTEGEQLAWLQGYETALQDLKRRKSFHDAIQFMENVLIILKNARLSDNDAAI